MAYTIENNYTGNGTTRIFSFTFPYLEDTDVKVSLNQVDTTNFEFANATQINFTADAGGATSTQEASGAPKSSVAIRVYRDTNIDNLQGEFFSGSAIRAQDLNNDFNQTLYVSQETQDKVTGMWNDTTETLDSTEAFVDSDNYIMTAAAINDRVNANIAVQALADGKIWAGNSSGVGAQVTPSGDLTMANTGAFTIANLSVENGMIANDAINGDKIADDAVDSEHLANGCIDTVHIANDQIDSQHYVDGSVDLQHLAADSVDSSKIVNGSIVAADIANDAIDSQHYVDGSIDNAHIADDAIDSEHYADGSIDTAHLADDCVDADKLASNAVVSDSIADGSIVNADVNASAAIAHTKLAAIPDGQILVGSGSTVPTAVAMSGDATIANTGAVTIAANAVEIGMIGCEQTTISDSDSHVPTSGAVVDYVAAQLLPFGGFEAIADEDNFPTSQPAAGVVISIKDATGVTVDGSGNSATCRTAGNGSDNVTITGFPSSMNSAAVPASTGLLVTSSGSSHSYAFHRLLPTTEDVRSLSDDVNDFFARYRIASSAPGSANDEGDLYFNTSTNKMNVYDGSSWGEVTSTGDFKILVLTNQNTTNAPTYNGSIVAYDLKEGSTSGSAAAVTTAAQLIVSVNGVIQQPNAGTNPSGLDGFVLSASDEITFCAGPPSGADIFVMQCGSAVTIPTPGDNTVTSAKIVDGAILNADINASADIAGSKLADDSISEAKLDIHAAPTGTDKFLKYTSNGMEWVAQDPNTNVLSGGTITGDVIFDNDENPGIDMTWDMSDNAFEFTDGAKIVFGTGSDYSISYHGTNNDLNITTTNSDATIEITGGAILSSAELAMTSADIVFGQTATSDELMIGYQHGGNGSRISNTHSAGLKIWSDLGKITKESNTSFEYLVWNDGAGVDLYHADTKEFGTKTGGVQLFGHSESFVHTETSAEDVTLDFSVANHFAITMGHNIAFGNPSTESVGQSGTIVLTQDGTGSREASWGNQFLWAGGTAPTLSTAAAAVDRIDYFVAAAGQIHCVASLAMAAS